MSKQSVEKQRDSLVGFFDVAMQDASMDQLLAVHNSLVPDNKKVKKFASKDKGLDRVWEILDQSGTPGKMAKILELSEIIGARIVPEKLAEYKEAIEEAKAMAAKDPVSVSAVTTGNAPKKGATAQAQTKGVTKTATAETPKKQTAIGRTGDLIGHFKKKNEMHVEEIAKLMGTTVLTVRNTIDAARRSSHIIKSQGAGIFKYFETQSAVDLAIAENAKAAAPTAQGVVLQFPASPLTAAQKKAAKKAAAAQAKAEAAPALEVAAAAEEQAPEQSEASEEPIELPPEDPEPIPSLNISGDQAEERVEAVDEAPTSPEPTEETEEDRAEREAFAAGEVVGE